MVETLEGKIRKLEGKQGAAGSEPVTFTVYAVETLQDGSLLRHCLKTGKARKVSAASLGIEPYCAPEPVQAQAGKLDALQAVPVPEDAPEAVQATAAPEEGEFERLRRIARCQEEPDMEGYARFREGWARMVSGAIQITGRHGTWRP